MYKKRIFVQNIFTELIEKPFEECTLTFMDKTFGMEQPLTVAPLTEWLETPHEVTDFERQQLLYFQQSLIFNVHNWNEYELDVHFIGPIFTLVNFSSFKSNHFSQRDFGGIVDNYMLSGKPDGMVASGHREPELPYFTFLQKESLGQEYKRELDPNGDPAGQALAAMLVAQQMEEEIKPMYGCYVVGSTWKFIALDTDRKYAISPIYDALSNDIFEILRILKNLKAIVNERIAKK